LFWIFAKGVLKEESVAVSAVGFALVAFAGIQLTYLTRLEKKLSE
jgi:hypothetical protein